MIIFVVSCRIGDHQVSNLDTWTMTIMRELGCGRRCSAAAGASWQPARSVTGVSLLLVTLMVMTLIPTPASPNECDSVFGTSAKAECETTRFQAVQERVEQQFSLIMADANVTFFRSDNQKNQAVWTAYVDSQCELEGNLIFGTAVAWAVPQCKVEAYQDRLSFLAFVAQTLEENNQ